MISSPSPPGSLSSGQGCLNFRNAENTEDAENDVDAEEKEPQLTPKSREKMTPADFKAGDTKKSLDITIKLEEVKDSNRVKFKAVIAALESKISKLEEQISDEGQKRMPVVNADRKLEKRILHQNNAAHLKLRNWQWWKLYI